MSARRPSLFKRFRNRVLADVAAFVIRGLLLTVRFSATGMDPERQRAAATHGCVLAFWHSGIMLLLGHSISRGSHVVISAGTDGEFAVRIVRHFGVSALRGSTRRGAVRLLKELARAKGLVLGITPDGPRGPRYHAQSGTSWIAARTGLPLIPVGVAARNVWHLRSWDRFRIPKPFTRCVIHFGDDVPIEPGGAADVLERNRQLLETALFDASRRAAESIGSPWPD